MKNLIRLASATLAGTNTYFEIFAFTNRDGKELKIAMGAANAAKPSKLIDCLREAGMVFREDEDGPSIVRSARELLSETPRYSGTILIDGGWYGKPGNRFVFGDQIIRPPRRRARTAKRSTQPRRKLFACPSFSLKAPMNYIGRESVPDGADGFFRRKGTIESWKEFVAEPAASSSRAMLAIAAAFAAPCLAYLGVTPFGIVLTGASSTGKTMCTVAAGSVVGLGDEMSLSSWQATPSRFEELARRHGDMLLPIDDLSTIEGGDRARFLRAANLSHWLSHGGRRERLTSAGMEVTNRPIVGKGGRPIVLTSYETSLADLAGRTHQQLDAGVTVRLIGVPAVAAGATGVFDGLDSAAHDRRVTGELVDRIKLAAGQHQGEVFVGWLKHLAATPSRKVEKVLKARSQSFVDQCAKVSTSGTSLRIAGKFAAIYAAGRVAIDAGFLPWDGQEFRRAIMACFRDAVAGTDNSKAANPEMKTLRKHLSDSTRIASRRPTKAQLKDGWRERQPDGTTITYVVGKALEGWFGGRAPNRLLTDLIRDGVLTRGPDGKRTRQVTPRGGGDRVRVYKMTI